MESVKPYCIDSDVLIDHLRGVEEARVFLLEASKQTTLYISVVSIVELYVGQETRDAEKHTRLDEFLKGFVGILLDGTIAQYAGVLRRDYQQPFADTIIAASAMQYNLRLVTKNTKRFQEIAKGELYLKFCKVSWRAYSGGYPSGHQEPSRLYGDCRHANHCRLSHYRPRSVDRLGRCV